MPKPSNTHQVIEYPSIGATYNRDDYTVYEYGTFEESSVLANQQSRRFLDSYETLEAAQRNYPDAQWHGEGYTEYQEPYIPVNPPEWFDPMNAGEHWGEEDAY